MTCCLSHRVREVQDKSGEETERVPVDLLTPLPVREALVTREEPKSSLKKKARLSRGGTHGAKAGEPGATRGRLLEGWTGCRRVGGGLPEHGPGDAGSPLDSGQVPLSALEKGRSFGVNGGP